MNTTYELLLTTLPEAIKDLFLTNRVLDTRYNRHEKYRKAYQNYKEKALGGKVQAGLDLQEDGPIDLTTPPEASWVETPVIWATDNYSDNGRDYEFSSPVNDVSVIVPRVEKAKELQKKRTKEKAEVFTPSWVCNLQNNLIDDETLYPHAFNTPDEANKSWTPTRGKIKFANDQELVNYVLSRRLEATAGEAPYLVSRYDTVSGDRIPVREENDEGVELYYRIGLFDRKMRVINQFATNNEDWWALTLEALKATYGYEWQGDNLLLARLNMLNSVLDYFDDFAGVEEALELVSSLKDIEPADSLELSQHKLYQAVEIISWNIWQMDGLAMVLPMSCSENCDKCNKVKLKLPKAKYSLHDSEAISVIRWGNDVLAFENFITPTQAEERKYQQDKKAAQKAKDSKTKKQKAPIKKMSDPTTPTRPTLFQF